mmetsp:Transcript_10655/g.13485  ORF Transcript_10655/g.13485 Transcript_10655/m.13485 type:complete len:88 (-) Transcript_10655:293-556(-)
MEYETYLSASRQNMQIAKGIGITKKDVFFSIYYDANPKIQKEVDSILKMDEQVLRNTHLKVRNKLWYVNIAKEDKNPYIQKVMDMEK